MPIFEYVCSKCGNKFEEIVMGDRDKVVPCPKCGNDKTEKQLSVIGGIATSGSSATAPSCESCCPGSGNCAGGGCAHGG